MVAIKDIKMPEDCHNCQFAYNEPCCSASCFAKGYDGEDENGQWWGVSDEEGNRPEWCPLIEIEVQ